jgi:RNA polymerase sigma-70 factor (ECF subfamily)
VTELPISASTTCGLRSPDQFRRFTAIATRPTGKSVPQACEAADEDLVERAKRDPLAFARLYRAHYAAIAGHVLRRVGDLHVAEDLAADVFVTAIRSIRRYRTRGVPFRAWLYRIATNTVNRWARKNRHRGANLHNHVDVPAPHTDAVSDSAVARDALLALSPKLQAVLALHHLEGMSVEEVAAVLGCRVGTVKSRLSRARDALREQLNVRR